MRFFCFKLHFPICGNDQEGLIDVVREMKFKNLSHFVRRGGIARAVMWNRWKTRKGKTTGNLILKNLKEWEGGIYLS